MKLAMQLAYAPTLDQAVRQAVELERAGLDIGWVAEAYSFDAPTLLGFLAARTTRLQLGPGIMPVFTRTPTLIAMTAAGLDELSQGRCLLGLGASGPQVVEGFHGVTYDRPLARTREVIDICRRVWRREAPLTHDGSVFTIPLPAERGTGLGKALKMIGHPHRPAIPIHLAALGAKNVELAAELADGWLPLFFLPEKADEVFGAALAAGGAKRSAELAPLEICAGGYVAIGDDDDITRARQLVRDHIALYVGGMGARGQNFYNALIQRYGYETAAAEIEELYLAGRKAEAAARVPDELVDLTNLCGSERVVKERIAAFQAAGVTILDVTPVGPDPAAVVRTLKGWTA